MREYLVRRRPCSTTSRVQVKLDCIPPHGPWNFSISEVRFRTGPEDKSLRTVPQSHPAIFRLSASGAAKFAGFQTGLRESPGFHQGMPPTLGAFATNPFASPHRFREEKSLGITDPVDTLFERGHRLATDSIILQPV